MTLLETNPTLARLTVQRDGLIGLANGLDTAVDKIDRLIERGSTLPEIGNAILDAMAAVTFVATKINAMADVVSDGFNVIPKNTECLTEIVENIRQMHEAAGFSDPPLDDDDKVVPFRRRISHSGPVGGDGPRAA